VLRGDNDLPGAQTVAVADRLPSPPVNATAALALSVLAEVIIPTAGRPILGLASVVICKLSRERRSDHKTQVISPEKEVTRTRAGEDSFRFCGQGREHMTRRCLVAGSGRPSVVQCKGAGVLE
jgi:hypothetical protein